MTELGSLTPLEEWRHLKDEFFKHDRNSPVDDRAGFVGLSYYPEDPAARVMARVERPAERRPVQLATSAGDERLYLEYGVARFEYLGESHALTVFVPADQPDGPRLFLPFADATSGSETYGAGRYLEPRMIPGSPGELVLDFNYAYHPYCVYAGGYSCPFPPASNRLGVEVRAGERLPA